MKTALLVLMLLTVQGCHAPLIAAGAAGGAGYYMADGEQHWEVRLLPLAEVRDKRNCGPDVLPNFGCWRQKNMLGGCIIIAQDARDTGDTERLTTIGKEVWKCVHGVKEY